MEREVLEIFMRALVDLNRLNTEPGEKSHMLASSIHWLQRQMTLLVKGVYS